MGLIKAALGAGASVLAEQWKEYFYCEALPNNILVAKGHKKTTAKSSNLMGDSNVISNGSMIAVADGQCMVIVDQGKVVDYCAVPGEFTYDASTEPSLFDGGKLGANIKAIFANMGKRFTYGGEAPKDQRVYYFNTKEITGNKFGTPSPVPFRVVDERAGIDIDISIRCFGEYSIKLTNPILFYTNVCGNVSSTYKLDQLESQMKSELLTALQPAFAKISEMGIRYSALPGHADDLGSILNETLSAKWRDLRGIEIVSCGVNSVTASEEDEKMLKEMQKSASYVNSALANAYLTQARGQAMQDAAKNPNAGGAMAFMNMNMADVAGMQGQMMNQQFAAQQAMYAQQAAPAPVEPAPAPAAPAADSWVCPTCGAANTGNFCPTCGAKNPNAPWECPTCGAKNTGNFCPTCGTKRP